MTDVLVVAENRHGSLADISFQLVTAGTQLSTADEDVHLAVVGENAVDLANTHGFDGVDTVHAIEYDGDVTNEIRTAAVTTLYAELEPRAVVIPHTVSGLDYAPAVASELDVPILTKLNGVVNADPPTVERRVYSSKLNATVKINTEPFVVTVWGGEFEPVDTTSSPTIIEHDIDLDVINKRAKLLEVTQTSSGDVDITTDDFLLAVGRGIEEKEHLDLVWDAAEALDATVAASRPLVELGWFEKERQVGQSGQVVSPDVYVAVGISGAIEHKSGMKNSETIIAINTDESAPIFEIADYGAVADLFDVLPEITEQAE